MREGDVGALLSVLHNPIDEMDVSKRYGDPPDGTYLRSLLGQLESVEESIAMWMLVSPSPIRRMSSQPPSPRTRRY
jgi:hypothetical protein